ncbi:hypothetical protein [Streptomyces sp. NPDC058247]|uniref:hypothetical protein n=1 Tax=Streptomyces sp. NPDC058247 TaxID=3346401 RepID=UPI0036EFD3C4
MQRPVADLQGFGEQVVAHVEVVGELARARRVAASETEPKATENNESIWPSI